VIHIITINLVIIVASTKLLNICYWAVMPSMSDIALSDMMDVHQSAIQYATYIVTIYLERISQNSFAILSSAGLLTNILSMT
jgi:hypothetical protein